ncbi:MAG: hypothetical protein R3213_10060, partial [Flavobacteriaceae bacterium]|nr:hypothetical protein [Flavobacteriaceae bacterium]
FLDTLKGGLTPVEEGGGKQTRSLELVASDGIVYTLRSINKYPDPLIPGFAKVLKIENLIEDGISAQHPYASIVVAELAKSIDIESTHPKVTFIPKQDALGKFSEEYGNALYMLEYESEGDKNWTKYKNVEKIIDTEDLQELKLELKENLKIDRNILVRARLFDILIGDWDRHSQQWGWALQKEGDKTLAIPIPADRDNAFFDIDGILPSLISNKNVEPELRPFRDDIDYMPGLVKPFDIYFLYDTPANIFTEEAEYIQTNLTDEVISKAFDVWPPEIYELNGPELISKIKARRDKLKEIGIKFREEIQKSELLSEPLKGTDDKDLEDKLIKCFECEI